MAISQDTLTIKNQIILLRQELIKIGLNKGLNHPEIVERSQELDKLIFEFQLLLLNK